MHTLFWIAVRTTPDGVVDTLSIRVEPYNRNNWTSYLQYIVENYREGHLATFYPKLIFCIGVTICCNYFKIKDIAIGCLVFSYL
jgi:hypothetical protein